MNGNRGKQPPPRDHDNAAEAYLKANIPAILDFKHTATLEKLLDHLKHYVQDKCGSISTSQLRNIFSRVKPLRNKQSLQLIRPRLAYVAARQNTPDAREVVDFLESVIAQVNDDKQVDDFTAFFEAIVAYHKFYHGKKSS